MPSLFIPYHILHCNFLSSSTLFSQMVYVLSVYNKKEKSHRITVSFLFFLRIDHISFILLVCILMLLVSSSGVCILLLDGGVQHPGSFNVEGKNRVCH